MVPLRNAVLALLLDGPASGYDLAKRFDQTVANFWHATRQQLYSELAILEAEGFVSARLVKQNRRPDKSLYRVTPTGHREMRDWIGQKPRPTSIKDEMLVRVQAADGADAPALLGALAQWRAARADRLEHYLILRAGLLGDRSEEEFLAGAERPGSYLTLLRGISFERENLDWADTVAEVVRRRQSLRHVDRPI